MATIKITVDEKTHAQILAMLAAHPEWGRREGWRKLLYDGLTLLQSIDDTPTAEEVAAAEAEEDARNAKEDAEHEARLAAKAARLPGMRESAAMLNEIDSGDAVRTPVALISEHARLAAWLGYVKQRKSRGESCEGLRVSMWHPKDRAAARNYVRALVSAHLKEAAASLLDGTHPALQMPEEREPALERGRRMRALDDEIPF